MKRIPLKLKGVCKSAIWGGDLLSTQWGKGASGESVAESWELTIRPKENSVIEGGDCDGMMLSEWLAKAGPSAIGKDWQGESFPLLVKFIDAKEPLSVQVHPDDAYASRFEQESGGSGKTEMWYIVEAEPGASLVYGLKDGEGAESFLAAADRGASEECLRFVPVKAGESYFIPAGQVHAIGGGILIAEIQQNSDLTYRIYDYGRLSADGTPRELHLDKARDTIRAISDREVEEIRYARGGKDDPSCLVNCPYFKVKSIETDGEIRTDTVSEGSFFFLLCVAGEGSIVHGDVEYPVRRGDGYFLPAGMGDYQYKGTMKIIGSGL